ncbi:hypothetical protein [Sinorhizobium meliloti]|uniref:hypothetical protein n=1 Tax=Rhizobium meliloti TaxID=382 RepID=UPI001F29642B|nr:hypothetical protein [Sinorhizobium meliloti]
MAEIQGKGALKAEATVERVLKELSRIGFSDLRRVFDANGRLLRPEERDVSRRVSLRAEPPCFIEELRLFS